MKRKIIYIFITLILIMSAVFIVKINKSLPEKETQNLYPLTTFVISVNYTTDTVITEDSNGNLWTFYGVEDWQNGDCCSFIMDNNGTPEIKDDKIVSAKYSAYTINRE